MQHLQRMFFMAITSPTDLRLEQISRQLKQTEEKVLLSSPGISIGVAAFLQRPWRQSVDTVQFRNLPGSRTASTLIQPCQGLQMERMTVISPNLRREQKPGDCRFSCALPMR